MEMDRKERFEMYMGIIKRANEMGLEYPKEIIPIMDIESADLEFKLDIERWLQADDFNFAHDFYGILSNIKRDSFPATDFRYFVPRFATK